MIPQWTVFETEFTSPITYANPFWDVELRVQFTGPNGEQQTVDGFWDGGAVWRVRFSPTASGTWHWQTNCSDEHNSGLHGQSGTLECVAYNGDNPLYQHGPLQLAANRRYFEHADGTPFFWLADTAWNGVLLSQAADWDHYLKQRVKQGFTAVQFVTTQWRGCPPGPVAYEGTENITLKPELFQREDERITALNDKGLIAAPVNLWTLTDSDPGQTLAEADAIRLARYQVARWGAHQVVWLLGGDGCYERSGLIDKFRQIGRATFGDRHDRLVTLHPCGIYWPGESFRDEDWFDFIGYQSGHGSSDEHVRWLVDGPPAHDWANDPELPVINLEPNYEGHPSYHIQQNFTDYHVRRAAYWSLLVSPPAGVTYGSNEIWVWAEEPMPAPNHPNIGVVQPWQNGLETPGLTGMKLLKDLFMSVRWTELEPRPDLIADQPGTADPNHFIAAAETPDESQAVLYLPVGGTVTITRTGDNARWFDPRTGDWSAAGDGTSFSAPDTQDWVLVVG